MAPVLDQKRDMSAVTDFDPFSPEFRTNPTAFYERMFDASPGFITVDGVPSAYVATHAQCSAILRDYRNFSSVKPAGLPGMQKFDFFNGLPVMNYSDPPDHTRRRQLVAPAFTRKRTEALNEVAEKVIDRLLTQAIAKGTFEVGMDVTRPLAMDVMLRRFLDVPEEDHYVFLNYIATIPLLDKLEAGQPKPKPFLDAWEAGRAWCRKQQELAQHGGLNNLIGAIIAGSETGAISEDEMMAMTVGLLIGGVATFAATAATCLLNLAQYPEVAARIRKDPLLAAALLEETLRVYPPVSLSMRFATNDVPVGEKVIAKGMPVYVMNAAACYDAGVFPDPQRFDIDRENARAHIAFGYGIHTCIGNTIIRAVVPLLIRMVSQRMPNLRLADRSDAMEWDSSTARSRHLKVLHLTV